MAEYLFQTSEFGISDIGIHLLRSGFNYQTIPWAEINSIRIEKGKELHNWAIVLLIGAIILIAGVYLFVVISNTLMYQEIGPPYKMMFLFVISFVGANFVYNSFRTGIILKINYSLNKYGKFPLKEIVKAKRLNQFKCVIKDRLRAAEVSSK